MAPCNRQTTGRNSYEEKEKKDMGRTGIVIEVENNAVKDTSLGVMTAAAGESSAI